MNGTDWLIDLVKRRKAKPAPRAPEPKPPRQIPWTNPVTTNGACVHDVIYSGCYCDLRKPAAQ